MLLFSYLLFTGPLMGGPTWLEIIKHLKLTNQSLTTFHFLVSGPHEINNKLPFRFYPFKSTRLSLPV